MTMTFKYRARAPRLKHKNIVQLFDTYEDDDRVYLVMEL